MCGCCENDALWSSPVVSGSHPGTTGDDQSASFSQHPHITHALGACHLARGATPQALPRRPRGVNVGEPLIKVRIVLETSEVVRGVAPELTGAHLPIEAYVGERDGHDALLRASAQSRASSVMSCKLCRTTKPAARLRLNPGKQ